MKLPPLLKGEWMDYNINFPNLHIYLEHVGKTITIGNFPIAYYGIIIGIGLFRILYYGIYIRYLHKTARAAYAADGPELQGEEAGERIQQKDSFGKDRCSCSDH